MTEQEEKYVKARKDLLEAAKSLNELTQQQQYDLAQELFGSAMVARMIQRWNRLCTWLAGSSERHLIAQKYTMPEKRAFSLDYQLAEREFRHEITQYSKLEAAKIQNIENRIHVSNKNIFEDMKDIAVLCEKIKNETLLDKLERMTVSVN